MPGTMQSAIGKKKKKKQSKALVCRTNYKGLIEYPQKNEKGEK